MDTETEIRGTLRMNPKVAVVIVNWNKKDYVINLLNSLKDIDYNNYEIIVVDNASTDDSVRAIEEGFPHVTLIVNKENLGGTGGFNTGMRYALNKNKYKYIWLLDNDADVEEGTLIELVAPMERDSNIGIAGSMILNPDNKELIVEMGSFISWKTGSWRPFLRYKKITDYEQLDIVDVDYVAACSALVRTSAISTVGLMDERFFLHWDDIDFCVRIKNAGYKVVAVGKSRVYHGVEKGFNPLIAYYDIRNGLLMISKHTKGPNKFFYLFNMLRGSLKEAIFFYITTLNLMGNLIIRALLDFIIGNFGKIKSKSFSNALIVKRENGQSLDDISSLNGLKILILPNGNFPEIKNIISIIKSKYDCRISLLIQADRKGLFDGLPVDNHLLFDGYRQSSLQTIITIMKIFFSKFDLAISPSLSLIPFSYAVKKYYLYDNDAKKIYRNKETVHYFWKLILVFFIGEILSICLIPIFYMVSFKIQKKITVSASPFPGFA